jgi:hypothetical protein
MAYGVYRDRNGEPLLTIVATVLIIGFYLDLVVKIIQTQKNVFAGLPTWTYDGLALLVLSALSCYCWQVSFRGTDPDDAADTWITLTWILSWVSFIITFIVIVVWALLKYVVGFEL